MPLVDGARHVHVFPGLLESFFDDGLQGTAFDLQFKHHTLYGAAVAIGQGLPDEQVGALASQAVLTVDVAAPVAQAVCL